MKSEPWKAAGMISHCMGFGRAREYPTRDYVASIHSILIFDESEAIHELDFGDLPGAVGVEVRLHICLGGYTIC